MDKKKIKWIVAREGFILVVFILVSVLGCIVLPYLYPRYFNQAKCGTPAAILTSAWFSFIALGYVSYLVIRFIIWALRHKRN